MLNLTDRYVVYLDPETLKYMYYNYVKLRDYPVMNKLFLLLHEGYINNMVVTPITYDHIVPHINDNKIEIEFLNMMSNLGQIEFHQRFTIRTLQLIRVISCFFEQDNNKPSWRDAFSSDPDARYTPGFNKYLSLNAQIVLKALEREKNNSQMYLFIDSFKDGKALDSIAGEYFFYFWETFSDLLKPYMPLDGSYEYHMKNFLSYEEIKDIPEFHIISNILYSLFETYGIEDVECGYKDDLLIASEKIAAYMPYCNYYISTVDMVKLVKMTGINEPYNVVIYDHNEESLYKLIDDLTIAMRTKSSEVKKKSSRTMFKKGR